MPLTLAGMSHAQAMNLFRSSQAAPQSRLVRDYCATVPAAGPGLQRARIYEFPWGFVAETGASGSWLIWNLYVERAWRTGTGPGAKCFEAAHTHFIAAEMAQFVDPKTRRRLQLTYTNGHASHSDASYACMVPSMTVAARIWVAERLLDQLWPRAIGQEHALKNGCTSTG